MHGERRPEASSNHGRAPQGIFAAEWRGLMDQIVIQSCTQLRISADKDRVVATTTVQLRAATDGFREHCNLIHDLVALSVGCPECCGSSLLSSTCND